MTSLSDRSIVAMRNAHTELAEALERASTEQLTGSSGASEWSVAQVLAHLGSGAEISLATLRTTLTATPRPGQEFTQDVWDRWNSLSPREAAAASLAADEELVSALEALTAEERETLRFDLGFLPAPVPLATYTGMRLNEAAEHGWDIRVGLDRGATIAEDTAFLLAEQFEGDLGFLLGFTAKPAELAEPAVIDIRGSGFGLVITDTASISRSVPEPTATFTGSLEAAIRLLAGRLTTRHTPGGLEVTGNVTLDDLRRVFPGY